MPVDPEIAQKIRDPNTVTSVAWVCNKTWAFHQGMELLINLYIGCVNWHLFPFSHLCPGKNLGTCSGGKECCVSLRTPYRAGKNPRKNSNMTCSRQTLPMDP